MSNPTNETGAFSPNVISFPITSLRTATGLKEPSGGKLEVVTPQSDELVRVAERLDRISKYPCTFDYSIYRNLERRYSDKPIRGGIAKSNPMKLVNAHSSCQQCLYAFEIDTYGRGCSHNCTYCYAKAELTVHGYWNNPAPVPVDLNEIRKIFYTVFETSNKSKWRPIMERKIPLRIGCMSDSFMWIDLKYKLTQELIKILNFYDYPYTIITRSDLVAHDEYLSLLRRDLCSVQLSVSSVNDELNRLLEPGAPSAKRRLAAISKVRDAGLWTTVRINPVFPMYPDGFYSNPEFKWNGIVPKLEYTTFEMVDDIADSGCQSVIAGFGRFSSFAMNNMGRALGRDLRQFFDRSAVNKSARDFHYSDQEIRYYYEELKRRCASLGVEFTVCYIGTGESHFWEHQDLWSNKKDCCNIKDRVPGFSTDAREIPFFDRLKFGSNPTSVPLDPSRMHEELNSPKTNCAADGCSKSNGQGCGTNQ